ncbi:MAG: LPS export ABC transporter permease LptG [Legionella sp.]
MKILDKYIAKTVLAAIALVTLMLTGLQIFILFVNQMGDLGKLDYGIAQVAFFVLMQMPYEVFLFFPMASLLGCLIGLGVLANHSELIVMRAAGMSIGQITLAVLKASLVVIVLVTFLGETLVPYMSQYANSYKVGALSGGQSLLTAQGMWLRNGDDFISITSVQPNNVLQKVYQFRFDKQHNLQLARFIKEARFENQSWYAYEVEQTQFLGDRTEAKNVTNMLWDVAIKPQILQISRANPDEMTLYQLYQYLHEQRHNQQDTHAYQLTLLQRLVRPFSTMVMMLLAIPFIFGPLRSSSMGSKLLVGAVVGFSFHILNQFLGPVSLVYQWPPSLAALAPTLLFALLGVYLVSRTR